MADETQIQDDASLLERFLTFLGRPQYMITSALGGVAEGLAKGSLDPVGEGLKDAGANAAMFLQEVGTGSWLHGLSSQNLVGLPTDFTTREDRPEVSDILRRADLPAPEQGSWTELGVNVLGGIPLDPMTYLGGLGLFSKAGRVAKAAATGAEVTGDLIGLGAKTAAHANAASRLSVALRQTEKGAAMLAEAGDDPKLLMERLLSRHDFDGVKATAVDDLANKLLKDDAFKAETAARLASPRGPMAPVLGSLEEVLPGAARTRAQELLGLDPTGVSRGVTLLGTMDQAPILNAAVDALEGAQALKPMGVPTLEVPFTKWWKAFPGSPEFWDKVGIWTPARLANAVLAKADPAAATAFADMAARLNSRVGRMFYDKVAGLAPQALLDVGRQVSGEEVATKATEHVAAARAFAGIDEAAANVIGRKWAEIGDRWWDLDKHGAAHQAAVTSAAVDKIMSSPFGGQAMLEQAPGVLPWATKATTGMDDDALKSLRLAYVAGRVEVAEAVHAIGGNVEGAMTALDHMTSVYGRMPGELAAVGAWVEQKANPFYIPHQASEALSRFMAAGAGGKKVGGQTYEAALQSVYQKRRDYPQLRDFYEELNKVADRFAVPRPNLDDLLSNVPAPPGGALDPRDMLAARRGLTVDAASDVAETNAFNLLLRRIDSHRDVIAARRVEKLAKDMFPGVRHATAMDRYLDGALAPLGARQSTLLKLLGGGEFRIGESAIGPDMLGRLERAAPYLGGARGAKATARGAEQAFVYRWPGFSSFFKPLLLAGPSYFTRNALGGVVAASLDPEIGVRGAVQIARTLKDLPLVYALGKHGFSPSDTGLMIRAVEGGMEALSPADLVRLQGLEFGGRKAADLLEPLRAGVLLPNAHHDMDFFTAVGDAARIQEIVRQEAASATGAVGGILSAYREAGRAFKGEVNTAWAPAMVDAFRALMKPLAVVNSKIENSLRTAAWLHYVGKGWDPSAASAKVRERFVDYTFNSDTERAVRDLFPFARYSIGITPTAVKGAMSPVGRAVGRAVSTPAEQAILPPGVRGQTSIPWPGGEDEEGNPRYATNLGLPFEPAMGVLGLLGLPANAVAGALSGDARQRALDTVRTTLGQAHPLLKTPAEIVSGSSFYSGQPIGERDRAPEWAPSWLPGVREETLPSGRTIKKWPPFAAHALMGFLPISRLSSEFDKFVKAAHGDTADYVNFLFGVKIRTVDTEREAQKVIERALEQAVAAGDVGRVNKFFVKGRKEDADPEVLLALEQLALLEKKRRARSR